MHFLIYFRRTFIHKSLESSMKDMPGDNTATTQLTDELSLTA